MTSRRLALLAALVASSVGATDAPPPAAPLPTPEQIDAVTGTQPMPALDTEPPAQLDAVSVDASRRREMAFRTVEVGLQHIRSDKSEDADVVVCDRMQRVGTHITKVYCATNRTWNYIRKETTRDFLGPVNAQAAPYPLFAGPVYELSPTVLNDIGKQFEGQDHAARLTQLTAEEGAARWNDEWNTPAAVVGRFARAFDEVSRLAAQSGDAAVLEQRMAAAIAAQGFSVEQYNELVARLESSAQFQKRVSAATQAFR